MLPTLLQSRPHIDIQSATGHALEKATSFRVLAPSILRADNGNTVVDEDQQHLLFTLRNALEGRGYRMSPAGEDADIVATIYAVNSFSSSASPRREKLLPLWRIGEKHQASPSSLRDTPLFSGPPSTAAMSTRAVNSMSNGRYLPQVAIVLFDGYSAKTIWSGQAAALSENGNIRISSQQLVRALTAQIPLSHHRSLSYPGGSGQLGLGYAVVTVDGERYHTMVTGLEEDGAADKSGLSPGDMILSINGTPTQNRSAGEMATMLAGSAGSQLELKVLRAQQHLTLSLTRSARAGAEPDGHVLKDHSVEPSTKQYVLNLEFKNLDELSVQDTRALDSFIASIEHAKPQQLKVVAHTDNQKINPRSQSRYRDNLSLSQARAKLVAAYVREALHLGESQISSFGMGASSPLAENNTAAGREKNRRLEIAVTGRY